MLTIRPIAVDTGGRRPTAGALHRHGGAVAFADGEVICWQADAAFSSLRLGMESACLTLSDDGRFLSAVAPGGTRLVFVELPSGREKLAVDAPNARRQPVVATITGPLGLFSRTPGKLEGVDLGSGAAFERSLATFRVAALQPISWGRQVGLLGHFEGETKDSFALAPVEEIAADPAALDQMLTRKAGLADHAYRLALGPYGDRHFVGARDPEDDEDEPDPGAGPLYGVRGGYVRGFDGIVEARLRFPDEIPAGTALCGSGGFIAWEEGHRIRIARLAPPHETEDAPARWLAAAPDGSAVLVTTPDGGLGLIQTTME